jgi:hypothetical protein
MPCLFLCGFHPFVTNASFVQLPEKYCYLRNRKHFPCFYRVIETRVKVWEKREIAWEHEHEVRVSSRNFEFLPNFHKCFYNRNTEKMFSISFIK